MDSELLPVVDENGVAVGAATRGECHGGSMLLHPVVHLHLQDPDGRLYLQLRPEWKKIQPGRWDTAVGGHVDLGECVADALRRETSEEIGLEVADPEFIGSYLFESEVERELVYVFRAVADADAPRPSDELAGGRFWTADEIEEAFGKGTLTPNFEGEYRRFRQQLTRRG